MAFDYSSPAELFLARRRGRHTDYRRFATAVEVPQVAIEFLEANRPTGAMPRSAAVSRFLSEIWDMLRCCGWV
jgi:hypothetical protein